MENNNPIPAAGSASLEKSSGLEKSQSAEDLSEYTDADESVSSAPTEFLAEFLSAVMMKDYETALKYCKLILQYEPENAAAKEFYPLILEKIELMESADLDNSNGNSSDNDAGSSSDGGLHSVGQASSGNNSESDSDATTASYSSLEDEEAEAQNDNADAGNGNTAPPQMQPAFQSASSDSESPTEPISQQQYTIAQLRARVTPAAKAT